MPTRILIATLGLAIVAIIIATAAHSEPVHDPANEDADSDRAVDYDGIVVVDLADFVPFHPAENSDGR